ncbi:MAG: tetratricopeptide repeat protein, partial [Anaerolineae bacterium]|nr:tetratricopeptide repeat protein [Anaerolineae bacterium]
GESLYTLAGEFLWPAGTSNAAYSSEAMRIMPKVVTWLPEKSSAWYRLGVAMYLGGEHNAAIAAYQTAIERDPDFAHPWNSLGNVYSALGRTDDAIAAYQTALDLDPDYAYLHNNLADAFVEKGENKKAMQHYEERIRLEPQTALNALVMLGILSRHDGDTIQSRTYCEQALEIWDTVQQKGIQSRSGLFENRALALLLLERKDEAMAALVDALDSRGPADVLTTTDYELLQSAPQPPDGIDDMLAMARKAIGQ